MTDKKDLLAKLKIHAEGCVGEERKNAMALLDKLMKRYGIEMSDIAVDSVKTYEFSYKTLLERKLLNQIVGSFIGKSLYWYKDKKKVAYVDCSISEKIIVDTSFEYYRAAFEKEMETFYLAFLVKCNIFPSETNEPLFERQFSAEEIRKFKQASKMAMGMDDHQFYTQIGNKPKDE